MLCLQSGDYEDPIIFSPFSLCKDLVKLIEPVGEAFENIVKLYIGESNENKSLLEDNEEVEIEEEDNIEYEWEKRYRLKIENNVKKNKLYKFVNIALFI